MSERSRIAPEGPVEWIAQVGGTIITAYGIYEETFLGELPQDSAEWRGKNAALDEREETMQDAQSDAALPRTEGSLQAEVAEINRDRVDLIADKPDHVGFGLEWVSYFVIVSSAAVATRLGVYTFKKLPNIAHWTKGVARAAIGSSERGGSSHGGGVTRIGKEA